MTNLAAPEVGDLFAALQSIDETANRRLHDRLIADAEREGILDVAYRALDTPVGALLLAATAQGLVRVAFATEDHARVLATLAERISPRVLAAPKRLDV
ncbi:MAG: methylated-DNA--[protein]-cysteine S-methyltransferase, partial [Chloroflexota bacterium]